MIRTHKHILRKTIAVIAASTMLLAICACGSSAQNASPSAKAQVNHGNVIVFTPSDGLNLSRKTPLSTWDNLVPEIVKSLKKQGFSSNAITTKSSNSLYNQSQDIQDYVVNTITSLNPKSNAKNTKSKSAKTNVKNLQDSAKKQLSKTTIVVAPWTNKNGHNNYGDYVTQPDSNSDQLDEDDLKNQEEAENRLSSALELAKKAGMHVVMLSRLSKGFKPDILFNLSSAQRIGEIQAYTLVQKLALNQASKDNPKSVEVLLPCHNQKQNVHFHVGINKRTINSEDSLYKTPDFDDEFSKLAFEGIWKVLKPYFESGLMFSPSGKLNKNSTENDWKNVAIDADNSDSVKAELEFRLIEKNSSKATPTKHVDGIIALEDQVAMQTESALEELGYKGSSADINPSFTLPDIIGNFIGKRNLSKKRVPLPSSVKNNKLKKQKANKKSNKNKNTQDNDQNTNQDSQSEYANTIVNDSKWPIITGYGAYKDALPNLVNGKQWMTSIENIQKISSDVAKQCNSLNTTGKITQLEDVTIFVNNSDSQKGVPVANEDILAISATNLKALLIDPGYVTLADAGL
ncbi:hypothetical protein CJ214_00295 [Peptoniphilus lacrimalis]|nr:hypothetical protein [Gardnerella vaginalis]PMC45464.1 hypothetical protein CJ214_00295 [Peptoniphilus lacrimalis]RDW95957.1 hypothetical protein gvb04_05040 [Gardnerella vaginalis]